MDKVKAKTTKEDIIKVKKTGIVVSDKNDKTVIVEVTDIKTHPIYLKQYRKTKRYQAHDEKNSCKIGDQVVITQCKPKSKNKTWVVIDKK